MYVNEIVVDTNTDPDAPYPVLIGSPEHLLLMLTKGEASDLAEGLTAAVESLTKFVQVKFNDYSAKYTYVDPTGELKRGDTVIVPVGSKNKLEVATVTTIGPGGYKGAKKAVYAKANICA